MYLEKKKNASDMLHYGIFTLMSPLKTFKRLKRFSGLFGFVLSSHPLAEYSS